MTRPIAVDMRSHSGFHGQLAVSGERRVESWCRITTISRLNIDSQHQAGRLIRAGGRIHLSWFLGIEPPPCCEREESAMPRGRPLDVEQELLEAFRHSGRVNEYLVSVLPASLWLAAPPPGRGALSRQPWLTCKACGARSHGWAERGPVRLLSTGAERRRPWRGAPFSDRPKTSFVCSNPLWNHGWLV